LEQCKDSLTLATKSCKGSGGEVGLFFYWDVFGIEWMVGEQMVTLSFGGVVLGVG